MTNEQQKDSFLKWIADNYDNLKKKHEAYCINKGAKWSEDIFCDTYLKVAEKILKKGIQDLSENGFKNYFFIAFKINIKREEDYCRNKRRIDCPANLNNAHETYLQGLENEREKILHDLRQDFFILYILEKVNDTFGYEMMHLLSMKELIPKMTYKKLSLKVKQKGIREKILEVKRWVRENVTKDEIDKAFKERYSDFFNN